MTSCHDSLSRISRRLKELSLHIKRDFGERNLELSFGLEIEIKNALS